MCNDSININFMLVTTTSTDKYAVASCDLLEIARASQHADMKSLSQKEADNTRVKIVALFTINFS